jgi:hypothetical protein
MVWNLVRHCLLSVARLYSCLTSRRWSACCKAAISDTTDGLFVVVGVVPSACAVSTAAGSCSTAWALLLQVLNDGASNCDMVGDGGVLPVSDDAAVDDSLHVVAMLPVLVEDDEDDKDATLADAVNVLVVVVVIVAVSEGSGGTGGSAL